MEVNEVAANEDWNRNPERPVAEERSLIDQASWNVGHWKTYYDTVSGQVLDSEQVSTSMTEELK